MERLARIAQAVWTLLWWALFALACGAIWLARMPQSGLDPWLRNEAVPTALAVGLALAVPAVGTTLVLRWLIPSAWVHVPVGVLAPPLGVWILFTIRVHEGFSAVGGSDTLAQVIVLWVGVALVAPAILAWFGIGSYYRWKWARARSVD